MKTKDLNYYLSLDYDVVVSRMEEDGDVVYKAYSGDLDSYVFYGAGGTKIEALKSFEATKNEMFKAYFEEGRSIPEPTREDKTLPSGKFLLRIDSHIHYQLVQLSRKRKKSLNSYIEQILVANVTGENIIDKVISNISGIHNLRYSIYEEQKTPVESHSDYLNYNGESAQIMKAAS